MPLQLTVHQNLAATDTPALAVVFCDKDGEILGDLASLDGGRSLLERAQALQKTANFRGDLGDHLVHYSLDGAAALALVGVGAKNALANRIAKVAQGVYAAAKNSKSAQVLWGNALCQQRSGQFAHALLCAAYRFDRYKSEPVVDALAHVALVHTKDRPEDYQSAVDFAQAIAEGQAAARDVANEPGNVCTPSHFAQLAQRLADEHKDTLRVKILDEKALRDLGMGAFLAVSQGSNNPGQIAVLEYFGKSQDPNGSLTDPIALVGKGITFDTGGISLKPAANMDEMKFDMGGAAAMFGVAKALCRARLAVDVVVILALAENMPSGKASRPGDVVKAMNGTSIEILNTDAEGRLVLCDALCYAQHAYKPAAILDAATLTGACVVALGSHRSGLYSNDEDLLFALEEASDSSGDLVWHMPLGDEYAAQLKSSVADLQNIGGPKGGSVTAACFLQKFIQDGQAWVHLDIAGTAWQSGDNKGATGRPVALLMHYLKNAQS